jgi:hypothetical protein
MGKMSNMDKKVVKCIFIGYKEGMKGYKLWDTASSRTMYIRDVAFTKVGGKSKSKVAQIEKNTKNLIFN